MLTFFLWILLALFSLPLALLALVAYPFIWLLALPFRLIGISVKGAFALLAGIVMLPGRLLSRSRDT